jgi:DNA polymerase-4
MTEATKRVRIKRVSVTLHGLVPITDGRQQELALDFSPAHGHSTSSAKGERLCRVIDALNRRFGKDTVTLGFLPQQGTSFTGTKISFTRVPEIREFDGAR